MKPRDLLRRRLDEDRLLREAVLMDFEVVDDKRVQVRHTVVATAVAKRLGVKGFQWPFLVRVGRCVAELGAERIRPKNRRVWRKLRRRG